MLIAAASSEVKARNLESVCVCARAKLTLNNCKVVFDANEMSLFMNLLSSESILQGGSRVELQGGKCGQGLREGEGRQAKGTQADPSGLFQATHQRTATSHHTICYQSENGTVLKISNTF